MTDGQWARCEPSDIEIFATGATVLRDVEGDDHHVMADLLRWSGATLHDGYEHAREMQARPGPRPGVQTAGTDGTRRGGRADIVRPVAVHPATASAAAVSGTLFDESVPHLRVEHDGDAASEKYLVWQSTVTHGRRRGVPATLHLLASPSMVVTVLELVPQRRLHWHRRRFVRDGIAALEALAARLERTETSAA